MRIIFVLVVTWVHLEKYNAYNVIILKEEYTYFRFVSFFHWANMNEFCIVNELFNAIRWCKKTTDESEEQKRDLLIVCRWWRWKWPNLISKWNVFHFSKIISFFGNIWQLHKSWCISYIVRLVLKILVKHENRITTRICDEITIVVKGLSVFRSPCT